MAEQEEKPTPEFKGGDKAWFWSKYILMLAFDVLLLLGAVATSVLIGGALFGMGTRFFAIPATLAVYLGLIPGRKLFMVRFFDRFLADDVRKFKIPGLIEAVKKEDEK